MHVSKLDNLTSPETNKEHTQSKASKLTQWKKAGSGAALGVDGQSTVSHEEMREQAKFIADVDKLKRMIRLHF